MAYCQSVVGELSRDNIAYLLISTIHQYENTTFSSYNSCVLLRNWGWLQQWWVSLDSSHCWDHCVYLTEWVVTSLTRPYCMSSLTYWQWYSFTISIHSVTPFSCVSVCGVPDALKATTTMIWMCVKVLGYDVWVLRHELNHVFECHQCTVPDVVLYACLFVQRACLHINSVSHTLHFT